MLFGTRGLMRDYFRDLTKGPSRKIDYALEAKRLELMSETNHRSQRSFLSALTRLAKPYYWGTDNLKEKALNWTLLVTSLGLTFYNVTEIAVGFNELNRQIGDYIQQDFNVVSQGPEALQNATDRFWQWLLDLRDLAGQGLVLGVASIAVGAYAVLRLARRITDDYIDKWTQLQTFYHMQNKENPLDNPDQRIQDDPSKAADLGFELFNDAFDAAVSVATFGSILWAASQTQTIMGVDIPRFMFTSVFAFVGIGTLISHYASKPLQTHAHKVQTQEGDFRGNARELYQKRESIALNNGEDLQNAILKDGNKKVYKSKLKMAFINAALSGYRGLYHRVSSVVPIAITIPRVWQGTMQLGDVFKTIGAFSEVKNGMSFYVNNAHKIRVANAYMNRLIDIDDALKETYAEQQELAELAEQRAQQNDALPAPIPGAE